LKLLNWNAESARRSGLSRPSEKDLKSLSVAADLGSPRVDLVIFKNPHRAKDEQDFLALVEFKSGWIDGAQIPGRRGDRDKLLLLLQHIDTCPYGVVCGWAQAPNRKWACDNAKNLGDQWFETEFQLEEGAVPYFFCASVFGLRK